MIRLRYMSIRPIPNLIVFNHPVTPEIKRDEEIRRVPVPGIGVVFKESAPLLEKVEERVEKEAEIESEEKARSLFSLMTYLILFLIFVLMIFWVVSFF